MIDLGEDHHWLLKLYGEKVLGNRIFTQFKNVTYRLIINYKENTFKVEIW